MGVGVMGELVPGADIARCVDSPVGGPQFVVHRDQLVVECHARLAQLQSLDVGAATGGDQYLPRGDAGSVGMEDRAILAPGDVRDQGAQVKCHAVGFERRPQHASGRHRPTRQHPVRQLEQVNVNSQTCHRLGHLAADGSGAENRQLLRRLHQIEQGFVGEGIAGRQPGYRRHRGPRASRDHESPRTEPILSHGNALPVRKVCGTEKYVHPVAPTAFHRVVAGDVRPDLP